MALFSFPFLWCIIGAHIMQTFYDPPLISYCFFSFGRAIFLTFQNYTKYSLILAEVIACKSGDS